MRKKELHVKVSYETNRFTEISIANAYEKVVPVIKHSLNLAQEKTQEQTDTSIQKMFQIGGH